MTAEKRQRRSFPEDFKREAVALVTEQGYKVPEATLVVHMPSLRNDLEGIVNLSPDQAD